MTWLEGYQQVEARLREFWSDHPDGRCITELVTRGTEPGDVILFKASVWRQTYVSDHRPREEPDATGYGITLGAED